MSKPMMWVPVQGHVRDGFFFDPNCACKSILDGVGVELCYRRGKKYKGEGFWVFSFADLKAMYEEAVRVRRKIEKLEE